MPMLRTPGFAGVVREMDEMQYRLRRFFNEGLPEGLTTEPLGWMPKVEIVEEPEEIILKAELPGMTRDDVELLFEDDVLVLRGEKKEEKVEDDENRRFHLWERTYGAFRRAFVLPRTIDQAAIKAEFMDGVLIVHMPKVKAEQPRGRKIEITK
jgi:HSP20 family protein